jgi:hypothetical protein
MCLYRALVQILRLCEWCFFFGEPSDSYLQRHCPNFNIRLQTFVIKKPHEKVLLYLFGLHAYFRSWVPAAWPAHAGSALNELRRYPRVGNRAPSSKG